MNTLRLTNVLLGTMLLANMIARAWGQQCPDWSPYFDQIDDSAALRQLQSQRSQGWANFEPANNGGASLQQSIAQGEQLIQQLQQRIQSDAQTWAATAARAGSMPNVSAAQCRTTSMGANMVAACDAHEAHNMLLGIEGMNDLMRCRAGMAAGSYASSLSGSLDSAGSSYPSSRGSTAWDRGTASVADLNVSKRAGMVDSVTRNWRPPSEMSTSADSLPQSTALSDPFADAELKSGGDDSGSAPSASVALPDQNSSSGAWTDPLATENTSSNPDPASDNGQAYPAPTQDELASTLKAGISNSGETNATPVAIVTNASDWSDFSSGAGSPSSSTPGPTASDSATTAPDATDDEIDHAMKRAGADQDALSEILPHNDVSDKFIDEGIEIEGAVAHQMNHTLNDAGRALLNGDATPAELNSDIENFRPAIGEAIIPGYKYLNAIDQEATSLQKYVSRKVQSLECLFSFDPYCK